MVTTDSVGRGADKAALSVGEATAWDLIGMIWASTAPASQPWPPPEGNQNNSPATVGLS